MPEYIQMRLTEMVNQLGEEEVKSILSQFVCPLNEDVQNFIRVKAIEFSKKGLSKTTLVYWISDDRSEKYLVGYYTIALKYICVSKNAVSKTVAKKLGNHGNYNENTREYIVSAPLIAQLGKNYATGNEFLISGSDLLKMATDKVHKAQEDLGGKFVYLECEDKPRLIQFYKDNGFTNFGKRKKDRDERDVDSDFLVQMLKYLK